MKATSATRLQGRFVHVIYSPRGEIEGVMLEVGSAPIQVVFDKHDDGAPAKVQALQPGQALTIVAAAAAPSPKGRGEHAVYDFRDLVAVDGKAPDEVVAGSELYRGRVERLNYARHGAVNGVVLDTGDFLHLKPEGYARLRLQVGDTVEADGDAQQLVDGRGWAVDATEVNGRQVAER